MSLSVFAGAFSFLPESPCFATTVARKNWPLHRMVGANGSLGTGTSRITARPVTRRTENENANERHRNDDARHEANHEAAKSPPRRRYPSRSPLPVRGSLLLAMRKEDGALTTATTTDLATKKSTRGMTERHKNFDLAVGADAQASGSGGEARLDPPPCGRSLRPSRTPSTLPAAPGASVAATATKGKK